MELRRLRVPQGAAFERAMQLYSISFPPHEQREPASQADCMGLEEYHQGAAFERAMQLYSISFPPHEQREPASQADCMGLEEYHFELVYDGPTWAGIILYWETDAFLYIEHFCMFPELRGKNYGRRALDCLAKKGKTMILEIDPPEDAISIRRCMFPELRGKNYGRRALDCLAKKGKTMILEIDPPEDAISIRRKGFYLRSGFVPTPFPHVHPPYHAGNDGHTLVVMSHPKALTEDVYRAFYVYLKDHVMKGCGTLPCCPTI